MKKILEKPAYVFEPSSYEQILIDLARRHGGWINAHTHLDRADTLGANFWVHAGIDPLEAATLPLSVKQNLTGELHKGLAYTKESLKERMEKQLLQMIANGTKEVVSLIDATPDIGMVAIDTALALKKKYKGQIDFKIGPQPIFGFKQEKSERWDFFKSAAQVSDVLGSLPEKDDAPNKIGYDEHLKLVLKLGIELGKEVHIHVDQANNPSENGTETLVEAVRWLGSPKIKDSTEPGVWAVHAISPSCYDEYRFKKLLDNLKRYNIGIICCPRAALSMRQIRPIEGPLHNSIARLLEMIKWEIPVRLGTDNIADIFIPSGSNNMLNEIGYLSDSLRYYLTKLWVKIACGETPNDMDRASISRALYEDSKVFREYRPDFPRIDIG
ncbi:amidohydrolase family protein [Candidatus Falkowbacteria bacterium]|nr:amidohydrolase family protein [Candidatus Falkowbacteria bacterium]